MARIAFVFSGQGDQREGMGADLYEEYAPAKQVFDELEQSRAGLKELCFEGSKEDLLQTKNAQPCLFAYEASVAVILEEAGIKAQACAGFSLGEVAAISYAEIANLSDAFELVCKRGQFMQQAAENMEPACMFAILGLSEEAVISECSKFEHVFPVNFNCPGQIAVSGIAKEMENFAICIKEAGGKAIRIKTSGAFHSPFMEEASAQFATCLNNYKFNSPAIDIYSNLTGELYPQSENEAKEALAKQICSPVLWEKTICNMIEGGIDTFIEIGPGKTLCNLIRKTNKEVKTYTTKDAEAIELIRTELAAC